jgi:hypothetical protein
VQRIAELAPHRGEVLILGAPSVARSLQGSNRTVFLVDRQPIQGVAKHLARDAATFPLPPRSFSGALIDPPWYPHHWRLWTAWVARSIGMGRDIFVSIWPLETRPSAASEINAIHDWLSGWAEIERVPFPVRYETPIFEQAAVSASGDSRLRASPGVGRLLRVHVQRLPAVERPLDQDPSWLRFTINDYQLALRLERNISAPPQMLRVANANEWIWPSVSRRAAKRDLIDLWSSRNEVAIVRGPNVLAAAIRTAIKAATVEQFENALVKFPGLLEWQIPRPPYRRVLEWHHPQ